MLLKINYSQYYLFFILLKNKYFHYLLVFSFFLIIITISSCKPQDIFVSKVSHVIGVNDMLKLSVGSEEYDNFDKGIRSAVLLSTQLDKHGSKRFCSGVIYHIQGNNYARVLSNHHCFAKQDEKTGLASEELIEYACEKTRVYFNAISGKEQIITRAQCVPETLVTNYMADLSLFVVAGSIPKEARSISISATDDSILKQKKAYIIHYPLGTEFVYTKKSLGGHRLPAAIITSNNCNVMDNFRNEQFEKNPILAVSFRHSCDLTKGSSGSPLITQESHELAGINWGGVKSIVGEKEVISNAAVKPSFVKTFINDHYQLDEKIQELISKEIYASVENDSKTLSEAAAEKIKGCSSIGMSNNQIHAKKENKISILLHIIMMLFVLLMPAMHFAFRINNIKND